MVAPCANQCKGGLDLMAAYGWTWGVVDWRVQLNIDNILDRRYFVGGSSYGLPRWGEVAVSANF